MAQLVASMSGVVLGGVVEVVFWKQNIYSISQPESQAVDPHLATKCHKLQSPEMGIEPVSQDLQANTLPRRCQNQLLPQVYYFLDLLYICTRRLVRMQLIGILETRECVFTDRF